MISNGKQVVCQYCQWDGYPTYTGIKLLEFLRDADLSQFKRALENTTIKVSSYEDAVSYTGSTKDYSAFSDVVYAAKRTLQEQNNDWPEPEQIFAYLSEQDTVSEEDLENYWLWTRDTGCHVLPLIYHRSLEKPPLELPAMADEYNGDYAWDIQGIYVLNLDDQTLKMTYNGYTCMFDMDKLPSNIEKTMLVFEKATQVFYEHEQEDTQFLKTAQAKGPSGLQELAAVITDKVGRGLSEDYPEIFPAEEHTALTNGPEQDFIHEIMTTTMKMKTQSLTAKIQQAEAKSEAVQDKDTPAKETEPER